MYFRLKERLAKGKAFKSNQQCKLIGKDKFTFVVYSGTISLIPNISLYKRHTATGDAAAPNREVAVYECISTFTGNQDKHEIKLNRGDIVSVLEKKDNGWWYVRDWHGRTGWAPASYLKDVHEEFFDEKRKIGK